MLFFKSKYTPRNISIWNEGFKTEGFKLEKINSKKIFRRLQILSKNKIFFKNIISFRNNECHTSNGSPVWYYSSPRTLTLNVGIYLFSERITRDTDVVVLLISKQQGHRISNLIILLNLTPTTKQPLSLTEGSVDTYLYKYLNVLNTPRG